MKKTLLPVLLIFCFATFQTQGQQKKKDNLIPTSRKVVVRPDESVAMIQMKRDQDNTTAQFINENRPALKLGQGDVLEEFESKTDQLGMTTKKYKQFYKGIEIEGAVSLFHEKGGKLESMNGRIVPHIELDLTSTLSEDAARRIALDAIHAETYRWQLEGGAEPKALQKISSKNYTFKSEEMRLVYQFDIYALEPLGRWVIEIDAKTGEVVNKYDRIHHHDDHDEATLKTTTDVSGTGESWYNGTVTFTADEVGVDNYQLRSNTKNIVTRSLRGNVFPWDAEDVTSTSTMFNSANDKEAISVHWATEASYDYFQEAFGVSGYNNNSQIASYSNYGSNQQNAFFDGTSFYYGDGIYYGDNISISTRPFVTLDIVGHEYTHAITYHTTGLTYLNESGALNESFSDIFGHNIEVYKNPTGWSWSNGNEVFPFGGSIREFSNPKAREQPDTYLGEHWEFGSEDNGGVHTNSGVMNYWYYLLVEGGSGSNDKGFQYDVAGIGLEKAADIVYRNLTTYITSTSEYADARLGAELSVIDLYGDGSIEHQAVMDAWDAVGVPSQTPSGYVPPELAFDQVYLTRSKTLQIPVLNMGLGDLQVTNVSLDNSLFTVDKTSFTLSGNGSDTLSITYSPTAAQTDMATMTITTDVNTLTVNLTGAGVDFPIANVNPTSINTSVVSGNTVVETFDLENTGLGNLNWSASAPMPLSLDVNAGDIAGGNTTQISVSADATGMIAGDYMYDITIATNDSSTLEIVVPLHLEVTGTPVFTAASAIDLNTVYSGVNFSRSFRVDNTGYDTLTISDVLHSNSKIEVEGSSTINIPAQSSKVITFHFNNLPVGSFNETITLSGNFPTEEVVVTGSVLANPLTVSLDTVRISLDSGEDGMASIDLTNLLTESLEVDIIPSDTFRTTSGIEPIKSLTKALVIPSFDQNNFFSVWDNINFNFPDVEIDYTTIPSNDDITYQKLVDSEADVLIIANAFFIQYSEEELDAIIQYVNEGHGLISYYAMFGFGSSHLRLAPLFGLSKNDTYAFETFDETSKSTRGHELFEGLDESQIRTSTQTVKPASSWDNVNLQGDILARSNDGNAIVVRNFNRIYYSDRRGTYSFQDNDQFLRNAIRFAAKSFGMVSTDLQTATIAASGNQSLSIDVKTKGLFDGDHLYYVNIHETATDLLIGRIPVKVEVNAIAKMTTESALTFEDAEIGRTDTTTLLIQNDGGLDLIIDDLVFDGTSFTTDAELPFVVEPYRSANLDFHFKPSAAGNIAETVTLRTNDLNLPNHVLSLTGTGVETPHLLVGADTIRLTMKQGTSVSKSIELQNLGAIDLNWSATTSFGEVVDVIDLPDYFIDDWSGVTYLNNKLYVGHRNKGMFYTVDPFTKQIEHVGTIAGSRIGDMTTDGTLLYNLVSGFGTYVYNVSSHGFSALWDYFEFPENNTLSASLKGSSYWIGPEWQGANEFYEYSFTGNKLGTYPSTSLQDIRAMDWLDNNSLLVVDHNSSTFNMKLLSFDGSQFDDTGAFDIIMPDNFADIEILAPYVWGINYNNKLYQIHFSDNLQVTTASGTISSGGNATLDYMMDVTGFDPGVYPFHLNITSDDPNAVTRIPIVLEVVEDTGGNLPPLISLNDIDIPEDGSLTIDLNDHIVDENSTVVISHSVISAQSDEIPGITTSDLSFGGFGSILIEPGPGINGVFEVQVNAEDFEGNMSSATFKVNVLPVNDAPSFTIGSDLSVLNIETQTIPGFITNISDNDHGSQNLKFVVTNDNSSLFAVQPQIDASSTLTFVPKENLTGSALVSVLLQDDGSADLGGQFQSTVQTFTINVLAPKTDQTITFGELPIQNIVEIGTVELTASASSGLPVFFESSDENIATIDGSVVSLLSHGSVTITASQSGNSEYHPADMVEQTLTITELYIWDGISWNNGGIPPQSKNLVFNGDYTLSGEIESATTQVSTGVTLTIGNGAVYTDNLGIKNEGAIIVRSGGALIPKGTVTGTDYQIDRVTTFDINTGRYSIVGSPIQNAGFDVLGTNALVYGYDETAAYNPLGNTSLDRFKTPTQLSQTTMATGKGYFSAFTGDASGLVTFSGTPNFGTINVPLSYTDQGDVNEMPFQGYNLISNPYAAAIDFTSFMSENGGADIDGSVYLWDDNNSETGRGDNQDYLIINAMGNTDSRGAGLAKWDGNIRSAQGFFIKANSATSVNFTPTMMTGVNSDAGYFRKSNAVSSIKLLLSDGSAQKATVIGFANDATIGKDRNYDAASISGGDLQLFSLRADNKTKLGIQGLPYGYGHPIQLGIKAIGGTHTISLDGVELPAGIGVVLLKDLKTNTTVDLTQESYTFSASEGESKDRFTIQFSNTITSNIKKQFLNNIYSYTTTDQLHVVFKSGNFMEANIKLMDLRGMVLIDEQSRIIDNRWETQVADLPPNLYLLFIETELGVWKNKVVVK
ncbi:MAG: M4 family metallopeptidase [Cyclobacteriaceae bacterium]